MWTLASIMLTLASMLTLTLASMWTLASVFKVIVVLFDSFVVSINFFRMAFITFACRYHVGQKVFHAGRQGPLLILFETNVQGSIHDQGQFLDDLAFRSC